MITAREAFEEAKNRVNEACKEQNFKIMHLEELEFNMQDLNNGKPGGRLFNELYTYNAEDGQRVEVHYWCYDQTKTFGPMEPDMNKFEVKLLDNDNQQIDFHSNSYED